MSDIAKAPPDVHEEGKDMLRMAYIKWIMKTKMSQEQIMKKVFLASWPGILE